MMDDKTKLTINMAIAYHLGYSIYHYDKSHRSSNYFMLMDGDYDSVNHGHRETVDEALADVPAWSSDLECAHGLTESFRGLSK